jgi:hypothetical protein
MVSVKFITPIAAPAHSDESIYYTGTRELQEAIREVRQNKIEEDRKKVDAAGKICCQ